MQIQAIDLFCGIGGLTKGLQNVGLSVVAGFDNDESCRYAYEKNNKTSFHLTDVRNLKGDVIKKLCTKDAVKVIVGCAPCQPFSLLRSKLKSANLIDEKYNLLSEFGRIIGEVEPDIISMENVPQLQKSTVYKEFIDTLDRLNYEHDEKVIYCPDYGISQTRRRFVLIASRFGKIEIEKPSRGQKIAVVEDVIKNLPTISAGEVCQTDKLHQSSNLSKKNLKRIRASVPGGTWKDWPVDLRCECHKKDSGQTYSAVYGRMRWDQIGPTITTQFYSYGTGRFGHPEQDRALSLREGALLQTFPDDYDFINPDIPFSFKMVARHIGNAVPVKLGEVIGTSIVKHVESIKK